MLNTSWMASAPRRRLNQRRKGASASSATLPCGGGHPPQRLAQDEGAGSSEAGSASIGPGADEGLESSFSLEEHLASVASGEGPFPCNELERRVLVRLRERFPELPPDMYYG